MDIKKVQNFQNMTWQKAKDMLIPEAQTFWIILTVLVAKICGNYLANVYLTGKQKKGIGFWKTVKFYLWIMLKYFLRIDVEPYLKKSITNKEIENES